ncbi:MAG: hypothetical protein OEZ38_07560 [Gammaproteobacteria bacterium]|nr:hypothetical protein [Gammaproteobacteria bacterium]
MSYEVCVDDNAGIIKIIWTGEMDLPVLKRHLLTYNHHISHTDHNVLYDFRNISKINLTSDDLAQLAELAISIFDPLLKTNKVAMLSANEEVLEFGRLFVEKREGLSEGSPSHGFFKDINKAMSWLIDE